MGEINRQTLKAELLTALTALNPNKAAEVTLYVDTYLDYAEAQNNIDQHGTVVFHPRTGSPINNPYLTIRDRAARILERAKLRTGYLWRRSEAAAYLDAPDENIATKAADSWQYGPTMIWGFGDSSGLAVSSSGRALVEWEDKTATFYEVSAYGVRTGTTYRPGTRRARGSR